jgi:hypothetical protein
MSSRRRSGEEVRGQRLGHPHRAFAIAGGADEVDLRGLSEQQLEPLGRERLIVCDQES